LASAALVAVAIVAGVGVVPVTGMGLGGEGCAEAAPAQDGQLRIAVVVDAGELTGAPGAESICVRVPAGATGADVLAARARLLGRPPPRWASSGLLCAIDGVPATGCGERVDGSYRYWAYHLGEAGAWRWASVGPAFRKASSERVEGWHYTAGTGGPADPPPRAAATPATICPAPPAVTVPPSGTPAPPNTAPGPDGAAGVRPSDPSGALPAVPGQAPADGRTLGADGSSPTTTVGTGGSAAGGGDPDADSGPEQAGNGVNAVTAGLEAASSGGDQTGTSGPPGGVLVVALIVVLVAAGAIAQARRRPAT
jgi:hypothetical protein